MRNTSYVIHMNRDGELMQEHLHWYTHEKYKIDNPFLHGSISYILLFLSTSIDIAFFESLFKLISYDNPTLRHLQVIGLIFAADIVAVYAGIRAKRIKQNLSKEKLNLLLLLAIPTFALITNAILRIATMPLVSSSGTIDAQTIAITIISIAMPIFTSIGNYAISFLLYDPLKIKMKKEEIALDDIKDYIRCLTAIKSELDYFSENNMKELDKKQLTYAKQELINDALILYADVRVHLMEHLGDPTSTNVLSKSQCDAICTRLNNEIKSLESTTTKKEDINQHTITFSDAA